MRHKLGFFTLAMFMLVSGGFATPSQAFPSDPESEDIPRSYSWPGTSRNNVPPPPRHDASYLELYWYYVNDLRDAAENISPEIRNHPEYIEAMSNIQSKTPITEQAARYELDALRPQMEQEWVENIAEQKMQYQKLLEENANQPCDRDINGFQNCPGQEPQFDENPSMLSLIGYHVGLIRSKYGSEEKAPRSGVYTARITDFQEQEESWWCGPAATRNVVHGFTNGSWNIPQRGLAQKWGILRSGSTYVYQVINYLNEVQFQGYGNWTHRKPAHEVDLKNMIYTSVRKQSYSKGVILDGIPVVALGYWTGTEGSKGHYDVGVGVDFNDDWILVGEVYGKYNRNNSNGPFHWVDSTNVMSMVRGNPGTVIYSTR
ncbi:hypothetical protein HMPREF0578_1407 [Mobiluncus mulieris 28-1]|uniref:C39 family peptidase n=1 Tax=Mobiluncus mulieris TaxID=2052 RepID=UPI0001BE7D7D|nr:C39 family peptidase [Mobiluncus mulieris]EEZ92078.1 hypothetical protein HMPREF0578_1407 [Mobiluncus mulieris 28-1]MCU9995821.1 hypothetical protein [Mobiluncus mulieris]MCV0001917.1 hypothetical protein [Mobiluncus mulieris]